MAKRKATRPCAICGRPGEAGPGLLKKYCFDCLSVWYDENETDTEVIREKVLSREQA